MSTILKPSTASRADLVAECHCGCIFEYGYPEIFAGHSTSTHSCSYTPMGTLYVACPGCRANIEVGSYELRRSLNSTQQIRAKAGQVKP